MTQTYQVYPALAEDVNQGWIWIEPCPSSERGTIRVYCCANDKAVYCEALPIDENFRYSYENLPRAKLNTTNIAVINAWYRARLGIEKNTEVMLEVIPTDDPMSQMFAALHHPQVVVRIATILAIASIGIGLIGILLSLISLLK